MTAGAPRGERPQLLGGSHLAAEAQEVWTRPVEVSYHLAEESVSSSSETIRILGIHVSGDRIQTTSSVNIFGQNLRGITPNARYAIGDIVAESEADGFYVIYVENEQGGLIRRVRRSTVRGYLLTMKSHGEVSKERADLDRFGHPPVSD